VETNQRARTQCSDPAVSARVSVEGPNATRDASTHNLRAHLILICLHGLLLSGSIANPAGGRHPLGEAPDLRGSSGGRPGACERNAGARPWLAQHS